MRQMLLTLLLWPKVYGHNYDVKPGFEPVDILGKTQFGAKVQEMMKDMPKWKQGMLKYFAPAPRDFHMDPRVEALHPDSDLEVVVRKAAESFFGEKLEEEPASVEKVAKLDDADPEPSVDEDAPPVKPVSAQNEDDEEDNMLWLAIGGVAVGAAVVWLVSTKSRQPIPVDSDAVSSSAGYAKLPEKRKPSGAMSDSGHSSGADQASRVSSNTKDSDIYSSIRRSLQDNDPTKVWESVRSSFSGAGNGTSPDLPLDRQKQPYPSYAADASSVSHTDSEEEISEVYDRVKKSLKNLNLLPKQQNKDTPER